MVAQALRTLEDAHPDTRALLPDVQAQPQLPKKLFATLDQLVRNAHRFGSIEPALAEAGAACRARGLSASDLAIARDCLLDAMAMLSGSDWTDQLEQEWRFVLDAALGAMIAGEAINPVRQEHGFRAAA